MRLATIRSVDAPRDATRLETARAFFERELEALTSTRGVAMDDLRAEAAPVLETLLAALESGSRSDEHEALALTALLGRRVATLELSPTTALASIEAMIAAARAAGLSVELRLERSLRAAAMEGLGAAIDERARARMIERAAASLVPTIVSPRVVMLVIAGCDDADAIAQGLARLGRTSLDADARACIVHVSLAGEVPDDALAEIAAFEGSAHMIGARAIYSGTPFALQALAARAPHLTIASTFEDALRRGLEAAEHELRPASLLTRGLKRLRG